MTVDSFTSFAPDRSWSFPIWGQAMANCGFPVSKALFCDNTATDSSGRIGSLVPHGAVPFPTRYPIRFDGFDGATRSWHFANLWNLHIPHFKSDLVLSLEDDVLPDRDFLKKMVGSMKEDVGAVGLGVRCRHKSAHLMVYRCVSIDPFILDRKNLVQERQGKVEVDSVSTSCCLFKRSLLDGFLFTACPNIEPKGGWGHEWSLMKKIRTMGLKVICDFDIPVKHYQAPDKWI